ncbi:MAG: FGGY-family carbohydrate kinase [Chloroflexota bacterium]
MRTDFSSRPTWQPNLSGHLEMRGAWLGFSWGHTRPHFFRAILESIAFEYAWYLRILREAIPTLELTETRAVGGGARSDPWNQIKADILNVPYQRLSRSEFGTWGSAMIAGKAAGIYDDLASTAMEFTQPAGDPIRPSADAHAIYQPLVDRYIQLQQALTEFYTQTG